MTPPLRVVVTLALTVALMVGLGACTWLSTGGGQTPSPLPSVTTPSQASQSPTAPATTEPTTSSSPTATSAPSESTAAEKEATAAVRTYYETIGSLAKKPTARFAPLAEVARGDALKIRRVSVINLRSKGWRQVGDLVVTSVKVDKIDGAQGRLKARVSACWDVSAVDVQDRTGKSVVAESRPEVGAADLTLQQSAGRWYVIKDVAGARRCD